MVRLLALRLLFLQPDFTGLEVHLRPLNLSQLANSDTDMGRYDEDCLQGGRQGVANFQILAVLKKPLSRVVFV
jgi:hypothetical protein